MADDVKTKRAKRNKDLLARIKEGHSGIALPTNATNFPPRPIVPKDPEAIKILYSASHETESDTEEVLDEK